MTMNKLIGFVKEFTKGEVPEVSKVKKIGRNYFLMGDELLKVQEGIAKKAKLEPYSAGLSFGELIGGRFKPGFPLLDLLSKHTTRKAVVNEKGQTMFLYRNNLFPESIKHYGAESGFVLVMNEQGEVLGYGEVKEVEGQRIITHKLDRSDFLRRENRK